MPNILRHSAGTAAQGSFRLDNAVIGRIRNIMTMLNNTKNPAAILQQASQQEPMLARVMQLCQGRNPEEVFREMCGQAGIDPQQILSQIG